MHIQNPVILTKTGKTCITLELQSPGILTILKYWEPWHFSKPVHAEPSWRFNMECFAKIVESYNCFSKALCLRYLAGFWICPSLNKCSLTCRVTSGYETYSEHKVFFRHIQPYCGIFRSLCNSYIFRTLHIQNPRIFKTHDLVSRTLSRQILAYSEHCVTHLDCEPCHILDFGIFRTQFIFRILFIWAYSGVFRHIQ